VPQGIAGTPLIAAPKNAYDIGGMPIWRISSKRNLANLVLIAQTHHQFCWILFAMIDDRNQILIKNGVREMKINSD